jgi:hypothetical protein
MGDHAELRKLYKEVMERMTADGTFPKPANE